MKTAPPPDWAAAPARVTTVLRSSFFWQLTTLVSLGLATRAWLAVHGNPEQLLERWGAAGPAVSIVLQALTTVTPLGTSLIPTVNGALFPLALAVSCNLTGGVLGATVMYAVWRRGDRELQIARDLERLPGWARRFVRDDVVSLAALRLLPWAGGNLANLLAGARGVSLPTHLLAAVVGSLPGSLLYALLGAGLVSLRGG